MNNDCGECPSCRFNAAIQTLTEIMDPTDVLEWYQTRNKRLNNQTPESLIFVGQHDAVIREINKLVGGVSWQCQNTITTPLVAPSGTIILPMARAEFKDRLEALGLPTDSQDALVDNLPTNTPILMALNLMD